MDSNTKQAKQTFSQAKKKSLTLEARHSISIEASNKIRSKLSPRLFIPRPKATTQICSKSTILGSENFQYRKPSTDFPNGCKTFSKCHIENLNNRFKGKYTKMPQRNKKCKAMEVTDKTDLFQSKCQNIKILKKSIKRKQKCSRPSLKMGLQCLEKSTDLKLQQNQGIKLSNKQTAKTAATAKENALRSWGNLKIIGNDNLEDSARYLTDGDIVFIDETDEINLPHLSNSILREDKNTGVVQCWQTNDDEIFKKPANKNSLDQLNKNNSNSPSFPINETDSKAIARKKFCKSLDSKQSNVECPKKASASKKNNNKVNLKTKTVIKNAAAAGKTSKKNSNVFQNTIQSPSRKDKIIVNENIENKLISKYVVGENLKRFAEEKTKNTDDKAKSYRQLNVIAKKKQEQLQPTLNIKQSLASIVNDEKKTEHLSHPPIAANSSKDQKPDSKDFLTYKYSPIKTPLASDLGTATTAIADFQDAVRSSIAFIYDCSPIDQKINEDLIDLENCFENCSKYLLQSYNDLEEKEFKTNNCIEYLRRKDMERREYTVQNRCHTSSLNPPDCTEETTTATLTIFIEADKMPKKSITYKTSDILYPKLNSFIDGTSETPVLRLKRITQATRNLRSKNSTETITNLNTLTSQNVVSSQTQSAMEMQQSNKQFSRLRKKVCPVILSDSTASSIDSTVSSTQIQMSASSAVLRPNSNSIKNNPNYLKVAIVGANPYNLIYTQAQNKYNTLLAPKPLNVHTGTRRYSPETNQVLTASPVPITNCYNYHPAAENVNTGSLSFDLSKSQRPHFYQVNQNLKGQLSEISKDNLNRFVYQNSLCRVAYLQNHYNYQYTESNAYNSQSVNNCSPTNLPAFGDIQMGKH